MRKIDYNLENGFKILFTCVGRRVALINSFRNAAAMLGKNCKICGSDITNLAAGMQVCDTNYTICTTQSPDYISSLLDIVRRENINIIIPTTDHDLLKIAQSRDLFSQNGCFVLVPEPEVIKICQDKRKAFKFLLEKGFKTPETFEPSTIPDPSSLEYPCFLKPWDGYASRGATVVNSREEYDFYSKRIPNCIVQRYIKGTEITSDVFTDESAKVRCVVPRRRIETRGGEVNKAAIVKDQGIIDEVTRLAEILKTQLCILTIQLIKTDDGSMYFIEINPRFGGGVPLAIKAGANFPLWLLEHLCNMECRADNSYQANLTMLRYDAEIWL